MLFKNGFYFIPHILQPFLGCECHLHDVKQLILERYQDKYIDIVVLKANLIYYMLVLTKGIFLAHKKQTNHKDNDNFVELSLYQYQSLEIQNHLSNQMILFQKENKVPKGHFDYD